MADSVTLSAPTLEGQLAEVAGLIKAAEINSSAEILRVAVLFDPENGSVFIGARLPATFSHSGAQLQMTAQPYLGLFQPTPLNLGGFSLTIGGIAILI